MVVERLAVTFVVVVVVAAATSSMPVLVMGDEKAPSCPDEYSKLCGKDSACTTMVDTACRTDSVELIKGLFAKLAMVGGDNYDFASTAWPWGHEALRSAVDAHGACPGNKTVGKFAGEHCIKDLNEACKDPTCTDEVYIQCYQTATRFCYIKATPIHKKAIMQNMDCFAACCDQKKQSEACRKMIDMVSAVQELSGLTTRELSDMLKESDSFVLRSKPEGGGPEQVLLDDVKLAEQVMDLIFFVLSILSHWKKEDHLGASPFIHSSLVAASLHLMTSYFSSQWHELVHILLTHPKVDIFMDVAFDSLHEDTRLLSVRLSTLGTKAFPVGPFDSQLTYFICQQCEASLQFLLSLCQQKLFRDRILKNKKWRYTVTLFILKLGVPEWLKGSTDIASSISRQKAKILSILLQLCESESISYLGEVATLPRAYRFEGNKTCCRSHDKSYPMGSVLISALRLADVFSDDSNFRSSFITNTLNSILFIFSADSLSDANFGEFHDEFVSSWCSVDLPVLEDDANLDYDPFGAADLALLAASNMLTEAKVNYSCNFRLSVCLPYNMHRPEHPQERDLFLQKFQKYLLPESPKPSLDHPAADEVTIVCTNLGSLSHYAKSLIPGNLLNEEDVQLLSDFAYKLQRWCKSQVGQRISQQPQATRASVPDPNMDGLLSINGGLLQNSVGQNLIHLGARTTSWLSGASTATSMEVPRCRTDEDERQPSRRGKKLTIMNDGQVNEIENALGAEITSSQLKNWLNNRKAKLARIAKERGVPYEGEGADKSSTPATSHSRLLTPDSSEPSTQDMTTSRPFTRSLSFEPGRPVLLIDNEGNEVGRGEIFQVEGRAQGKSLAESHICIVDVTELKVEKWSELPHPSEASGRTFLEAESRHGGVMRVAWAVGRLASVAGVGWLVLFCGVGNVERSCPLPRLGGRREGRNSE
ncbi:hypothetical protein ZWY2020_046398 [Hordeum vulgare]|nr:hypothetical protein ZWY2020_046398 [Hordeum vulgare]